MVRAAALPVFALSLVAVGGCTYDFEAASERYAADPSTGGSPASSSSSASTGGASGGAGGQATACFPAGDPGPKNLAGEVGATPPYTYWYWPQQEPLKSLEWGLSVDFEPPNDGYFWAHQFGFLAPEAQAGFVGIQEHGTYVADPPDGPTEIIEMALFSVQGALDAEAGLPSPDGSVRTDFDGQPGFSVHIRYQWSPCITYLFRLAHIEDDPEGNGWYGAWIRDSSTDEETMIGRILIPAAWGTLSYWSVFFSERFGFNDLVACEVQEHASAVFLRPTGNVGRVQPSNKANQFQDPPHCASSRFTDLGDAVRQEMGVPEGR